MSMLRSALPAHVIVVVALSALIAGCGGSSGGKESSVASSGSTPQSAVRGYFIGLETVDGAAVCNVIDDSLRKAMVNSAVGAGIAAAHASCAQALSSLAKAIANTREVHAPLPPLHVAVDGDTAKVSYVALRDTRGV